VRFVERKRAVPVPGPDDEHEDPELDALLEDQHNTDFKEAYGERPFWRLIVLHAPASTTEFTACWVYHHALGDGVSGVAFYKELTDALQAISRPSSAPDGPAKGVLNDEEYIVASPSNPLLPPIEHLHALPLSIPFLLKQQWRAWFPKREPGLWTGSRIPIIESSTGPNKPDVPRMHVRSIGFSHSTTQRLVAVGRENGVTVQATLQCLLAAALFSTLNEGKYNALVANGPISLRRFLGHAPAFQDAQLSIDRQIGTWVGQYEFTHRRQGTKGNTKSNSHEEAKAANLFSWAEAQKVKAAIQAELDKKLRNSVVGLLRFVSDVPAFFRAKMGSERTQSFEVSNVGVFPMASGKTKGNGEGDGEGQESSWKIGRCVFSQSASVAGAALLVGVVTGGDGCAVLSFNWLEGALGEVDVEVIIGAFREGVEGLVKE
jgi:hypothetical protein